MGEVLEWFNGSSPIHALRAANSNCTLSPKTAKIATKYNLKFCSNNMIASIGSWRRAGSSERQTSYREQFHLSNFSASWPSAVSEQRVSLASATVTSSRGGLLVHLTPLTVEKTKARYQPDESSLAYFFIFPETYLILVLKSVWT